MSVETRNYKRNACPGWIIYGPLHPSSEGGNQIRITTGLPRFAWEKVRGSNKFWKEGNFVKKSWKIVEVFWVNKTFFICFLLLLLIFLFSVNMFMCRLWGKNERISTAYNERKKIVANAFKRNEKRSKLIWLHHERSRELPFFSLVWDRGPSYLRVWMTPPPPSPPAPYLKVWIRPCDFRARAYCANISFKLSHTRSVFLLSRYFPQSCGPFAFVMNTAWINISLHFLTNHKYLPTFCIQTVFLFRSSTKQWIS